MFGRYVWQIHDIFCRCQYIVYIADVELICRYILCIYYVIRASQESFKGIIEPIWCRAEMAR